MSDQESNQRQDFMELFLKSQHRLYCYVMAARIDALHQCIGKLKADDQHLLSLRYQEGATLRDLAGRVGLSINTLYSRLSRLHLMLMNCIKQRMAQQ